MMDSESEYRTCPCCGRLYKRDESEWEQYELDHYNDEVARLVRLWKDDPKQLAGKLTRLRGRYSYLFDPATTRGRG